MTTVPAIQQPPSEPECRALLKRIIDSKEFQRATRLREFLNYAVERKFAEAPEELTESLIGHRVFRRSLTYNTGDDSIVRTEARILRQRLETYFNGSGIGEQIILEIPKGGYVPLFRFRERPAHQEILSDEPAVRRLRRPLAVSAGVVVLLSGILTLWRFEAAAAAGRSVTSIHPSGSVEFTSSDSQLVKDFEWAKKRALEYSYTGDPVGDWYESTAGAPHSFCMREVSHQSVGAAALGLAGHTRNMLQRFAASISPARAWRGFGEINKDGFPALADHREDAGFNRPLPANFDVMRACYRQFLWTGDTGYFDPVFSSFYDRTVTDYVAAWDRNRDGVMESDPKDRPGAVASYFQEKPQPLVGADLIAAQYAGYSTYASLQEQLGNEGSLSRKLAHEYRARAVALRALYNTEWWNVVENRHYSLLLTDRKFYSGYVADVGVFALLFGLSEEGPKTDADLDAMEENRPLSPQILSYFPEILFEYGRNESAYRRLLELGDADFPGRSMPEVVFGVIGAITSGLFGVSPDAPRRTLETLPRLPTEVGWAKLSHLPVLHNVISIQHRSTSETLITNESGPTFQWEASFPANTADPAPIILVDGQPVRATIRHRNQLRVVSVFVTVRPGQSQTARYVISTS